MSIYGALPLARKCNTQQEPGKKWRAGGFEMQTVSRTLGMEFFIAFFPLLIYICIQAMCTERKRQHGDIATSTSMDSGGPMAPSKIPK